jgi:Glycosyltransferase sugar-binding region containing DXD motif
MRCTIQALEEGEGSTSQLKELAKLPLRKLMHQPLPVRQPPVRLSVRQTAWQDHPFIPGNIPYELWQTYRTKKLPGVAQEAQNTWRTLNPELRLELFDDAVAAQFIAEFFGADVLEVFKGFPLGVMRADLFRYAILFARGGIYSDVDTRCLRPIERWFDPHPNLAAGDLDLSYSWSTCSAVIAMEEAESGYFFCQWVR